MFVLFGARLDMGGSGPSQAGRSSRLYRLFRALTVHGAMPFQGARSLGPANGGKRNGRPALDAVDYLSHPVDAAARCYNFPQYSFFHLFHQSDLDARLARRHPQ